VPELELTLVGETSRDDGDRMHVRAIEIRRTGERELLQLLGPMETETPIDGDSRGLEVVDMNFDGYGDLRLIEFLPASPNVSYLNWLYDPETGLFERSPELDELSAPVFDSSTRSIHSAWRDGAARYGTDDYEIVDGKPQLVRREITEYTDPRVYRLTISERIEGVMQIVEEKVVRE